MTPAAPAQDVDALGAVVRRLALDGATSETFRALAGRDERAVLIKGPVIARWLYEARELRPYVDIDVFVPLQRLERVEDVLRSLSFQEVILSRKQDPLAERHWERRRDGAAVDLHVSLWGSAAPVERQWAVLTEGAEQMEIGGTAVTVPRPAVNACLLGLHVAKHGRKIRKPVEDLRRALNRDDVTLWKDAVAVATELEALEALSSGLRLVPSGMELARSLDLPVPRSRALLIRTDADRRRLLGIDTFLTRRGVLAKLKYLVDTLVPPPAFMAREYAFARRGRAWLALAYAVRPFDLAWRAAGTLPSWRKAGRRK